MNKMKKLLAMLLLAAMAACLLTGCEAPNGAVVPTATVTVPPTATDVPAAADEPADDENANLLAVVNGVEVDKTDAYNEYQYYAEMYTYYGYGAEEIAQLRADVANHYVELELIRQQYEKLGLKDELDMEALNAAAAAAYEEAANSYLVGVDKTGMTEEQAIAAAKALLDSDGYDMDYFERLHYDQECISSVMAYYEKELNVTEEDIRAYYDRLVARDQQLSEGDPTYYEVMTGYGERVLYVPEGLRAVKHILVLLSETDQDKLYALETELEKIETDMQAEGADITALTERKERMEQEIDAVYATIEPKIAEIQDKLNNGEDFIALMEVYGEDPGMTREPNKTNGYYVHAQSQQWVLPFRDGAMALEKVGDISEPVRTSYGLHIIRYEYDVPAGAVAYESVYEELKEEYTVNAFEEHFNAQIAQWKEASEIEVFAENLDK